MKIEYYYNQKLLKWLYLKNYDNFVPPQGFHVKIDNIKYTVINGCMNTNNGTIEIILKRAID